MPIIDASLEKESRDRYLTYALSVVSGRALPDVRDGLKPVQRRILYAMLINLGLTPNHTHRKSAAVVGEVLAKFHPHGDIACYDAMVRMAQDFALRYPLVDGQGNFGSLDGDGAAAYRYTEAKLREFALDVIGEIGEETVNFRDNFDGTTKEPAVFPSRVPNLLVNGASGIAVGMATSFPPHNLRDTIKALIELSLDPEISHTKLSSTIKAPDFPTACAILNSRKELNEIYKTGRGTVRMRAEWGLEDMQRGKKAIIISAIPYAINKSQLVEKIANLIIERKIPQLSDIRDESTHQIRVVLELSSGADAEAAMAYLFKHTALESNFAVNFTALVPVTGVACRPELLSLKDCLQHFLNFREEVTEKKLAYEKKVLKERIHILQGFVEIYDALDVALKIVRSSSGRSDAAEKLRARFKLSEIQAFAVVDMRIYQLSKTNIEEMRVELKQKEQRVKEIDILLKSKSKIRDMVRKDLQEIAEKHGDKRLSRLETDAQELEFNEEAYVVKEDVFAIVTKDGWIKRIRQSNELGSTRLREGDSILRAHALSTVDTVIFLTNQGYIYSLKALDFPASSGYGDPIQKIMKFRDGESIVESFAVVGADKAVAGAAPGNFTLVEGKELLLVSKSGVGYATKLEGVESIKRNGKRIIKPRDGDSLAAACPFTQDKKIELALFTRNGSGLCIPTQDVPVRDAPAVGVSLMGVREEDELVSALIIVNKVTLKIRTKTGKVKELESADIVRGHRALKGNKVSKDEIEAVEF